MIRQEFKKLLIQLDSLTRAQKQRLLNQVKESIETEKSINLIESHFEQVSSCKYCGSCALSKWGKSHQLQRYRCKDCNRTFNALTGTNLARLRHKERWISYSECLNKGLTVRKAAEHCCVDLKTAFRWRHRFLIAPTQNKQQQMVGIVEADETFFTQSHKGDGNLLHRTARKRGVSNKKNLGERIPVLIVRDRSGTVADFVFDRIEKNIIHDCLRPLMSKEVVLCSDGSSIYKTFAKEEYISHRRIIGLDKTYVIDDIFHIQNLNAYTSRLKSWMVRFNGVATKYLPNYLGWRRILEKQKEGLSNEFCFNQALGRIDQQLMPT